ncbi:peptidylprolyl isomerase [Niallia sp. NCCP-28]|uniref:peptidylprolyl isomerase n=1 Tax=Niallia sp. NCCP-28 TaxID=2934712 RepID=UPI00208B9A04|nr:peptidylprolyl isomerase [Niallia sp. NCCP-28]GKU81690.1 foldase protein PrsA [Niallia sp. NCCP-28]
MKKWILSLTLAAGVISLSACSNDDSEAIVKSDAGEITKEQLYDAMKEKYGASTLQPMIYEKVLAEKYKVSDKEIDEEVNKIKSQYGDNFLTAIQQYGYNSEEDLRTMFKTGLLQQKAAVKNIKVTDKEIKAYYEDYQPDIKVRHILVADEKTAKEVKKKLDNGEKFATVAKKYSTDTATASKDGDLGWISPGTKDEDFEKAAFKLKVDAISDPVKTTNGYEIIQVTDKKEKEKYEDVKDEMEYKLKVSKLTTEDINKAMAKELKEADVSIKDKDLKALLDTSN